MGSNQSAVDNTPTVETESLNPQEVRVHSPTHRQSSLCESDPKAFKITILLASSGYRTQISINRSFLEKESSVEGEGFLISQLKTAIWKDWPSGTHRA